jgi:hypothetical protein
MVSETGDRKVNLDEKTDQRTDERTDDGGRMPHERDESPDGPDKGPRGIMKQAASDLAQGLVDTDLRGTPGVAPAVPAGGTGAAKPQPDAADGMRGQVPPTPAKDQQQ